MSFINSQTTTVIRAKLTDTGRKLLAQGNLNYSYWVCGDSEIDYGFYSLDYTLSDNKVLAPKDKNYNIKTPIPSNSGQDIFNLLSNVIPIEQKINNQATTRGLFTGTTNTVITNRFKGTASVASSAFSGGTAFLTTVATGTIDINDIILVGIRNETQTGSSTDILSGLTIPYLTYKVQAVTSPTGSTIITVDRTLPTMSGGTGTCNIYVIKGGDAINDYYGSGSTTTYWNYNTLSFENNCNCIPDDVPVWNFNVMFTENLAGVNNTTYRGIDKYDSNIYNGFKEYLNYTSADLSRKSIGIIHYTNNTISNYYGENLKSGTFKLTLPTILWHKQGVASGSGAKIGLVLSAQTTTQTITTNSSALGTVSIPFRVPYDNLVDSNGFIVGKVFNELKIAVIEDEELIAAMSYKSNRNWTLPTLNGSFVSAVSESQGLIGQNEEVHFTYLISNELTNGYRTGLHCQNYRKINRGGTGQNNAKLTFPANELPFLKEAVDTVGGFTADKLYLLAQKVVVGQRPSPTAWKKIDVTSSVAASGSGKLNAINIEATSFVIDLATYTAAPLYTLHDHINVPIIAEVDLLNFGEEYVLIGNVDTDISATTYKSSFVFAMPSNQFRATVNPTYNESNNDSVFVSEVGIFNNLKELVAIGKLSKPIKKKVSDTVLIQLEIDF